MSAGILRRCLFLTVLAIAGLSLGEVRGDLIGVDQQQKALVTVHTDGTVTLRSGINGLAGNFTGVVSAGDYGFFAVDPTAGVLHRIHPTSGASTATWSLGFVGQQSLAFDAAQSRLFSATESGDVYSVDLDDLSGAGAVSPLTVNANGFEILEGGLGFTGLTVVGSELFAISGGRNQLFRMSIESDILKLLGMSPQFESVELHGLAYDGQNLAAVSSGNTDNRQLYSISTDFESHHSVFLQPHYAGSDIRGLTTVPEPSGILVILLSAACCLRRTDRQ